MPNPILPLWEYIPDGEPRIFNNRVYLYGSHDRAGCDKFCDYKLKVWSADTDKLNDWVCNGVSFRTRSDSHGESDVDWTDNELYAPDVVEKDGKYYLYAYIVGAKGCVGVSDNPEGPFKLLSRYKYNIPDHYDDGTFIDPGVFVDDDGRAFIYCGYLGSYMAEINSDNMYEIIDGSYKLDIIPKDKEDETAFFEACSMRKVGDTYYLIYSPNKGSRLAYATSDSPEGPFTYRGYIVDNGADYPGGNNHGSICNINGQWYIFYHRMTNNTLMSRRACVERIEILPDGTIPTVEMTSLGFDEALDPYKITPAEYACVLKGGCFISENSLFSRPVTNIAKGCVIGYKYFDFGADFGSETMTFAAETYGLGANSRVHILIDGENGEEIGVLDIGREGGTVTAKVKAVTGRHSLFLKVETDYVDWIGELNKTRPLFNLNSFVFMK